MALPMPVANPAPAVNKNAANTGSNEIPSENIE